MSKIKNGDLVYFKTFGTNPGALYVGYCFFFLKIARNEKACWHINHL